LESGGDIWLVILRRNDGKVVVISDDVICLYADDDAFDAGQAEQSIELHAGNLKRPEPHRLGHALRLARFLEPLHV
jgi:hypothetical protein